MPDASPAAPPPLTVAASLVAVQGTVLLLLAVVELADLSPDRRAMGLSTAVFFAAYGALLVAAAWALWRAVGWSRGPVLLSQLIFLGIAWTVREYAVVALTVALAAVVVLGGLLHRDSIAALEGGRSRADDDDRT